MLYPRFKVNNLIRKEIIWDTQKNIEEEEKWALKKEEQEKRIRKSKINYSLIQPPPRTL